MAIQDTIDYNVNTKDGRYFHSFVISGESGSANVPENVHIRFYNCNISSLTLNGKNGVFLEAGTVSSVTGSNSKLTARNTTFSGDATLTTCDVDLFGGTSTGSWKLTEKTYLRADNHAFSGAAIAIDVKTGSQSRATRCTFAGHGTSAVKVADKGYALLSKCPSVMATLQALHATDEGIIEAVECALIQGTGSYAGKVEKSGRLELLNCATVKGAQSAVILETKGFLVANKCQSILGDGNAAVSLDSEARADIRSFVTLKGQGDSALLLKSKNYVYVADGITIQSDAKDGVEAKSESVAEIVSIQNLLGNGRRAVTAVNKSKVSLFKVLTVKGNGSDGLEAENESRLSLADVNVVTGTGGHGLSLKSSSRLDIIGCQTINGVAGHGIKLAGSSKAVLKDVNNLIGTAGSGADLSDSSVASFVGCQTITGQAGDGISADSDCTVYAARCQTITGQAGDGIKVVSGGALHVSDVQTITGASSHGIETENALVRLKGVQSIIGSGGDGLNLINPNLIATTCVVFNGASGAGIRAVGRGPSQDTVTLMDSPNITGSDIGCSFESVWAKTQGCQMNGTTALKLSLSHHESTKDTISGDVTAEDSVLVYRESAITGAVRYSNSTLIDAKSTHGYEMNFDTVSALLAGTTLPQGTSNASGVVGAKVSLGSITLQDDGFGLFGGSGSAQLSGEGSVVAAKAGGPPQDGLDFLSVESDDVRLQDKNASYLFIQGQQLTNYSSTGSYIIVTDSVTEFSMTTWYTGATNTIVITAPEVAILTE